jgi:flagellar protein FliO/FliZ
LIESRQLTQEQKEQLKKAAWLLLLLLALILIFAFLGSNLSSSDTKSESFGSYSMWRVVGTLALLLAVFYLGARLYQRKMIQPENSTIRVISRQYLDTKHYLAIVEVDNERLLIGISDASINLLKSLRSDKPDANVFADVLKRADGGEDE